jgi:putative flippase GtrA
MKSQLTRFGSIGVLVTLVDFGLFALLANYLDVHYIIANILSTGTALCLSFVLNSRLTFQSKLSGKTAVLFVTITLLGLWVLQPIVITIFEPLIAPLVASTAINGIALIGAKLIATAFSLTWNYTMYNYVVFPEKNRE